MVQLKDGISMQMSVADFYARKSVFITGGTGFLGKILIEKLLYSCSSVEKIYILIRKKKDNDPEKRIKMLMDHVVFDRIRKDRPNDLKKVVPIVGDMSQPNLGLSDDDEKLLTTKVTIVLHAAATIKFNEPIATAVAINVEGTRGIINLCHRMRKIDAFVHVSTAFSNTDKKIIEEMVYPPPADLDEVYAFIKKYNDDEKETAKFLKGRPNTYTYTKALAEYLVKQSHGDLPTAIVRPSIVLSTLKEPLKGWLENWNGPTSIMYGVSRGIHRFQMGSGAINADIIPVDLVTNMTIAAASRCQSSQDLKVYNCCSSCRNPITYGKFVSTYAESAVARRFNDFPYPGVTFSHWSILILTFKFLFGTLPAFIADLYLRLIGKPPFYVKTLTLLRKAENLLDYFTSNEWEFRDENVRALINSMSASDRATFYCDPEEINWKSMIDDYFIGVSKYLLKKEIVEKK